MRPNLLPWLAVVVLSGGLAAFSTSAADPNSLRVEAIPPAASASPAAKDAYVSAQLAKLFAGAPVRVELGRFLKFKNWLLVDVFAADAKAGSAPAFSVGLSCFDRETTRPIQLGSWLPGLGYSALFCFDDEAAARAAIQDELHRFKSPVAVPKAGYDEFYSERDGGLMGRRGAIVVEMRSNPPEGFDAVLGAISKNVPANPRLLPDLIHYACTMHFGDTAPLHTALAKLSAEVPELSAADFPSNQLWGDNSVAVNFNDSSGSRLTIVAKAYDSETEAKAGQDVDEKMIPVTWNKTEIVQGVRVYEYTKYGRVDFQTGQYTFNLQSYGDEDAIALLLKVGSALIADLAPPAKQP